MPVLIHGYVDILVHPSSMLFNTCNQAIEIYIYSFSLKLICILIRLTKLPIA